jgi:hypothetical protein
VVVKRNFLPFCLEKTVEKVNKQVYHVPEKIIADLILEA